MVAAAPMPIPDGTLSGVVDTVAPITVGVGVTVDSLLGFNDSPAASGGHGGSTASSSGAADINGGGYAVRDFYRRESSSGVLGGVVDTVAPVTRGVGASINAMAALH
ncbi:hypothetical protein IWW38_002631 [Coemansia aciculifera]|uniref:Uncharacterized protein n=1 Tax=Coemansia aciculifera TaxID=417176 RepID=A0ACC1M3U4_9FUNG|nr:hypothetical protein IWW38_002631 [Coemansia aciculifera]